MEGKQKLSKVLINPDLHRIIKGISGGNGMTIPEYVSKCVLKQLVANKLPKCPTCQSPSPERHPAMQFEGEVQPCRDLWHAR